jgi:hypothetical protein
VANTIQPIRLKLIIDGADLSEVDLAGKASAEKLVGHYRAAAEEIDSILKKLRGALGDDRIPFWSGAALAPSVRSARGRRPVADSTAAASAGVTVVDRKPTPFSRNPVLQNLAHAHAVPPTAAGSWTQFAAGARTAAASTSPIVNILSNITKGLSSATGGAVNFAARLYVLERLGASLRRALVDPVAAFTAALFDAGDESRKFEVAMSSVLGSMTKARELNRALVRDAGNTRSALGVEALRDAARLLAFNPALSSRVTMNDLGGVRREVQSLAALMSKLAVMSPEQKTEGAAIAIRDLAEGGDGSLVSIRRRFGVTARSLARYAAQEMNVSIDEAMDRVKNDPTTSLRALDLYTSALIPDDAAERAADLVSNRLDRLRDGVRAALAHVADGGLYDEALGRLESLQKRFFEHLGSPAWEEQSRRLGRSLARVLDNVAKSVINALKLISGSTTHDGTISGTIDLAAGAVDRLAALSDKLPDLGVTVGAGLRHIGEAVEEAAAELGILSDALGGGAGGMVKGWAKEKLDRLDPEAREATRLGELVKRLDDMGIHGARVGTMWAGRGAGSLATVDTSGIADPARRMIAEKLINTAWADVDVADTRKRLYLNRLAREAIPNLDDRLSRAGATDGTAGIDTARQYMKEERYEGPQFGAQVSAVNALLGRVSANVPTDAIGSVVGAGRGVLSSSLTGSGDPVYLADVFEKLRQTLDAGTRDLDAALKQTADKLADAPDDVQLKTTLDRLTQQRADVQMGYDTAVGSIRDAMVSSVQDYGAALSAALDTLPPHTAADLAEKINAGTTTYANRIIDLLHDAGHAIDRAALAVPLDRRITNATRAHEFRLRAIDAGADLDLVAGVEQIEREARQARLRRVFGDSEFNDRKKLGYLRGTVEPERKRLLGEAVGAYALSPDEQTAATMGTAQANYLTALVDIDALEDRLDVAHRMFMEFGASVAAALENSVGNALYGLITGTSTLSDALRGFAQDVIRAFSEIVAHEATKAMLRLVLNAVGSAVGSGAAPATSSYHGATVSYSDTGAVETVRAFATGGVVGGPTLALIGERGAEAVIPLLNGRVPLDLEPDGVFARLPGGRRVPTTIPAFSEGGIVGAHVPPAAMSDATSSWMESHARQSAAVQKSAEREERETPNIFVIQSPEELWARGYVKGKDLVIDTIAGEFRKGGRVSKAARRRPG